MNSIIGISLFLSQFAYASTVSFVKGGTIENGGNSVYCLKSEMNDQSPDGPDINPKFPATYYSLDYARSIKNGRAPAYFSEIRSWSEQEIRMEKILRGVSPTLRSAFLSFAESTREIKLDGGEAAVPIHRTWVATDEFQIEENKVGYAPRSCLARLQPMKGLDLAGAIISFRGYLRTVTRKQIHDRVQYHYHTGLMGKLLETSPLQLSMLLIHEWLWDHTRTLEVSQRVNEFLHSREVEALSAAEVRKRLKRLGLRF